MSREVNILLLGETGAGKSTTLNALANYLKFATFAEALESVAQFTAVIPSQFTLPDPQTGKERVIKSGPEDTNERHGGGNSATIAPTGYRFTFGEHVLRVIDTPGIGDTSGASEDRRNFEQILNFLQLYKDLHGIIIVVKGNDSRKTTFFKYCITELLTHLHRSVAQNIMFCFTHSQIMTGSYGPGEGFKVLQSFLEQDIADVGLRLEPGKNCFFIENDAYRFLVAKKDGYPWNEVQHVLYRQSWDHSVGECQKMMTRLLQVPPHSLETTISLNNARRIIMELSEPLVQLSRNIDQNIRDMEGHKLALQSSTTTKEDLAKRLEFQVADLEKRVSDLPKMVCTSGKCTEVIDFQGEEKINYKTVCCSPCLCYYFTQSIVGDAAILFCASMKLNLNVGNIFDSSVNCTVCSCHWSKHMPVLYDYIKVMRKVVDRDVEQQLNATNDDIEKKNILIRVANEQIEDLKQELKTIEDIGSQFAYFLKANSMFTHNRYFEQYLDMLIDQESQKSRPDTAGLYRLKREHQDKVARLTAAIDNRSHAPVTAEDIPRLQAQLLCLKHKGHVFKQILEANKKLRSQFKKKEKNVLSFSGLENSFTKLINRFF